MRTGFFSCCGHDFALHVVTVQHKKLSVEGGGTSKDFRKGQKQGDLEIWDPVDQVLVEGSNGLDKVPETLLTPRTHVKAVFPNVKLIGVIITSGANLSTAQFSLVRWNCLQGNVIISHTLYSYD